jgi:hypothetical protein
VNGAKLRRTVRRDEEIVEELRDYPNLRRVFLWQMHPTGLPARSGRAGNLYRSQGAPPLMGGVPHMEGWWGGASALGWMGPKEGLKGSRPPDKATLNE